MDLEAVQIASEDLSPREYLDLSPSAKANIVDTRIVPTQLGSSEFGKIHVNYRDPIYKVR